MVTGSSSAAACALVVLQDCQDPVPIELLASAVGIDCETLRRDVSNYVKRGLLKFAGSMVSARPLPTRITNERVNDLLARTLRALVALCRDKERRAVAMSQLRNIARLSETCLQIDRELVASVFPAADKLLKATGDLHLVLDLARLSIRAAGRPPSPGNRPSVQMLRDKAQSLICGVSWVYQRTDRIAEARVYAEESLKLGEELGWPRNTAFCKKCIGRLLRLEAEGCEDDQQRRLLLRDSVASFQQAIPIFEGGQDPDLGKDCEDVGECLSLMGRSLLVAKDQNASRTCVTKAYEILERFRPSKAWADLLILDGELGLREGRSQTATDRADEVLTHLGGTDSEVSEIKARAHLLKAKTFESEKRFDWAAAEYSRAANDYSHLGDTAKEGRARWSELLAQEKVKKGAIPTELTKVLLAEADPCVRVQAVRLHKERVASRSGGRARSQRQGATPAYLKTLLADARLAVRRGQTSWD